MQYEHIYLGGTFDHLHAGHRHFISEAAKLGTKLHIGITADHLAAHKRYSESMQPVAVRTAAVKKFCSEQNILADLVTLEEPFGPAVQADAENSCLCVTTATESGGNALNQAREQLGLAPLPLNVVKLVAADDGQPIASERIRGGEISRTGTVYIEQLLTDHVLTEQQREQLRKIPYIVVTDRAQDISAYLVGDTTLERFLEENWPYQLAVFDGLKERAEYSPLVVPQDQISLTAVSPAHVLTAHLSKTLQLALKRGYKYVFVQGEEDLAAVAVLLLAPLGHAVYFGLPRVGLARIEITEAQKLAALQILLSSEN